MDTGRKPSEIKSKFRMNDDKLALNNEFICHLVYEHDFIQQFNNMLAESFDVKEHLFVVYANHAWDESQKYNLKNSYYINSFEGAKFLEYIEKCSLIVVHCLYTPELTNFYIKTSICLAK